MEQNQIYSTLQEIFNTIFNEKSTSITAETSAQDIENWDSMTHLTLITEIESRFSIEFKLKELMNMNNVGDMVHIIQSKIS
jgi:acyl carrier protein